MRAPGWSTTAVAQRFMWTVQALAAPAKEQQQLFPSFAVAADELALDHEEAQAAFLKVSEAQLSPRQRKAFDILDRQLQQMSGLQNAPLWTVEALGTAPEWAIVRELAVSVLQEMGWAVESPPRDRAIYVGPPAEE
jgi:hypothetical protein